MKALSHDEELRSRIEAEWVDYERSHIAGDNPRGLPFVYFMRGYERGLSAAEAELEAVKKERNQYAWQIKQQEIREEVLGERLEAAEAELETRHLTLRGDAS